MSRARRFASFALAAAVALPSSLVASDWPQWRGPGGQGISNDSRAPSTWTPETNVAWRTAIPGRGHSSPVVWHDRVFLTTAIEGDVVPGHQAVRHEVGGQEFVHPDAVSGDRVQTLKVLALDVATGATVWERTAYEGPVYDSRHRRGSFASSTPVTDGETVYVSFGSEGVYAYGFDGTLRWKSDIGRIRTLGLGTASSPILFEQWLILQCDENEGERSFIVALEKATGKEAWRVARPVEVSWSTPVIVDAGGRLELVANGTEFVIAYDPRTGRELWRTKGVESNAIHTPLVGHGLVFVTAGFPAKRVIAIRPGGSGDITGTDRIAWRYDKGTAYVATPILYGDYVYLITDNGILTCLDARTGEVKYEGGRVPVPARFMGSPVAIDGTLLLTSEDGDTFVIKAGPTHEVIRTNSVDEPVFASLAIAQGRVFVRGERHLYCLSGERRGD
ncbi:MAG: PQQ-binding-like beta-propeller repeat protein [Acidobacteria bacterium]|nr:PQQ-binding-like beta-propeller repeat protein [Acidobacteriota bacterium]